MLYECFSIHTSASSFLRFVSSRGYTYFSSKYAEQSDAKALHCGVV